MFAVMVHGPWQLNIEQELRIAVSHFKPRFKSGAMQNVLIVAIIPDFLMLIKKRKSFIYCASELMMLINYKYLLILFKFIFSFKW